MIAHPANASRAESLEQLDWLRAEMEAGRVESLAAAFVLSDRSTGLLRFLDEGARLTHLVGALSMLRARLLRKLGQN